MCLAKIIPESSPYSFTHFFCLLVEVSAVSFPHNEVCLKVLLSTNYKSGNTYSKRCHFVDVGDRRRWAARRWVSVFSTFALLEELGLFFFFVLEHWLRFGVRLVQNCLDDQLHPWSTWLQTDFSAIFQGSSVTGKKGREKGYLVKSQAMSPFSHNVILGIHWHFPL